ncbi:MAG: tryptophan--tRNA ligase, partial [Candidatus Omnitrophica bacterium]|nr:tryptophan--tRNA ligase [Candidatus Omnitrophota bacterium]
YKANAVPVGEDQLPHLELTREIVRRFFHFYKKQVFPEPEGLLTQTPRLLGVDNRKMSKSYGNAVNLSDSPEEVRKKIKAMITDPQRIKKDDPGHPDICNVYSYYKFFFPELAAGIPGECKSAEIGCVEDKAKLADCIVELLRPIQERRKKILSDRAGLEAVLKKGAEKARAVAGDTMGEVRKAVGI